MRLDNSNNNYSVYIHTNKLNGKRYVGITKQKPERRWQNGYGYLGTYFGNAIMKYGWDNFKHEVIFTGLSKEMACNLEIALIASLKTNLREYGYNVASGGQTGENIKPKKGLEHPNHKRVKQIDPITGHVINIFDSQSQASEALGVNRKGITKACQGILNTYKGFMWEYADYSYRKPSHKGYGNYEHVKQQKPIVMVDKMGNRYHFKSVKEASKITGIKSCNISRYLNGLRKDPERRWFYAS